MCYEPTDFEVEMNYRDFMYWEHLELKHEEWLIEQEERGGHYE